VEGNLLGIVSPKIDLIILNLVLMLNFGVNVSNLVLMPKKTYGRGHYNFIFS
jgi:hypothetical protein